MELLGFLIGLGGFVALLLWGVHMVQTGVQRTFGAGFGRILARAVGKPLQAFLVGIGITAALQSSTATGLMATSMVASAVMGLVPALAVMLGANVGTTLIVQLLAFDVSALAPLLILIGVAMFRRYPAGRARDSSRIFIGLGLLMLALHHLVELMLPYENAPALRHILPILEAQPIMAVLVAALITWAAHSSVTIVLLTMSMAAVGTVAPGLALALVIGANLGSALNPLLAAGDGANPALRRLPLGNLLTRLTGVAIALPMLDVMAPWLVQMSGDAERAVANFHTAFNIVLALLFMPWLKPFARFLSRLLPERIDRDDPATPRYLDPAASGMPAVALANASREALRMADLLETMLAHTRSALSRAERFALQEAKQTHNAMRRLEDSIMAYLVGLDQEEMTSTDHTRLADIVNFITNLEHAGDAARTGLLGQAERRIKHGWQLGPAQNRELDGFHDRVLANLRITAALFVSDDLGTARALAREKDIFRAAEAAAAQEQLARIETGDIGSVQSGSLHLDILRDLKSINSYLVGAAAYPVLEHHGELLASRLRED